MWTRAHPRSRGENYCSKKHPLKQAGSSPLTRGKQRLHCAAHHYAGLIPAHAGKTTVTWWNWRPVWAHPRSRGENFSRCCHLCRCGGSSPLTRGKLRRAIRAPWGRGLIPAHAGKTLAKPQLTNFMRAHPRSRGENSVSCKPMRSRSGSSPLTRGKPARARWKQKGNRLIPAHAGKTLLHDRVSAAGGAHPRSRGENKR